MKMQELINNLHKDEIKKRLTLLVEQVFDGLKNYETWVSSGSKGKVCYRGIELPKDEQFPHALIEIGIEGIFGIIYQTGYFSEEEFIDYQEKRYQILDRIYQHFRETS